MATNDTVQPMTVALTEGKSEASPSHPILLAEDNEGCQKLALCILTSAGYQVDLAENGQQVVEKVQQNSYDLILMDMQMPVMDGLIATMTIRNLGYRNIPIIGLTANAFKTDRDRCLAAGMNDYIAKPVAPSKLIEIVHHWLSRNTILPSSPSNEIQENSRMNPGHVGTIQPEENYPGIQTKGQVLVADDSLVNQTLIRILLQRLGFTVTLVDNGQQAIKALKARKFDLIFMDMQMPVMDGYEATHLIRSQSVQTPIIALTTNSMPQDQKKYIEAGCSDFLSKPIDSSQLVQIIEKYLKPISAGR